MSDKTILVIDDSATIRKLVDTHLSPCGYQVVLAPNAEDGLELASEIRPDLILLDHQLPGTTGFEVASKLEASDDLRAIPVVISSTLRKKAYAEYIELDNVVDMLPKPYTEDLLRTTVANAIETAAMIVSSQSDGTAVPETIGDVGEAALAGNFKLFGLREVIDFLNNSGKSGTLEVEAERTRLWIQLHEGRIQGVTATGISDSELQEITDRLPASLSNLAPVLKMTIGGQSCAEVGGFVQLLDQKVLDPRLLSKLLRFQSAMLIRLGFTRELTAFRFESNQRSGALSDSLPLSISLLALLVEGSLYADRDTQSSDPDRSVYSRRAIRGQNLDRAGLSARHMKILNLLASPRSTSELAEQLAWDCDEVVRVLDGFVQAELIEQRQKTNKETFVVFEPDSATATQLRRGLTETDCDYEGKVVRDRLAMQLVFKRQAPDCVFFAADSPDACKAIGELRSDIGASLSNTCWIAIGDERNTDGSEVDWHGRLGFDPDGVVPRPCTGELVMRVMNQVINDGAATSSNTAPTNCESTNGESTIVTSQPQPIAAGVEA